MAEKSVARRVIGSILVLITAVAMGFVGDCLYQLNDRRNRLHLNIASGDREPSRAELNNVKYFDGLARQWKMHWFVAGRYLLNSDDAMLYEVIVDDYLVGDYKKVAESEQLRSSDDYRAAHLVGVAKVRLLQAEYREEKKPAAQKKLMEKLVQRMIDDVSPYFKKAVENSPDFEFPDPNFGDRFNYDLTSDRDAAKRLIENKKPARKFILGIPQLPGDEFGDKKAPGEKGLNEETQPGAGGNSKKKS